MINLKKLFRRKKGQGALEYLFMIAAALIIIFVVVRYISGAGQQASQQSDIAALQSQAELVKSSFQAKGWWSTAKVQVVDSDDNNVYDKVELDTNGDGTKDYDYAFTSSDYPELSKTTSYTSWTGISTVYDDCQAGKLVACQIFGVLAGSTS